MPNTIEIGINLCLRKRLKQKRDYYHRNKDKPEEVEKRKNTIKRTKNNNPKTESFGGKK